MTIPQWVETLTADLAKLAALGVALVGVGKGTMRVWQWTKRQSETLETLQAIAAELRPNHGTSIRDSLDRIEARQVTHEQRWRIALYDHDKGIVELDARGLLVWANRTFREITGRDTSDLLGDSWALAVAPEDRQRILDEWAEAVAHGRDYETTVTYLREDGRVQACVRATALRAEPGTPGYQRRGDEAPKEGVTGGWVAIVSPCHDCDGQATCVKWKERKL